MTKIAKILNIAFGRYVVGKTRLKETTISNEGTERITIATISSSSSSFKAKLAKTLEAKFPINSTLYYGDANGKYCDANGSYYTTNKGFGIIGTTNDVGLLTPSTDPCVISISSPAVSAKIRLNTPTNVIWTSANVGLVNVIVESDYGHKIYENIDSSAGGGTQAIELLVADGFVINEDITITVKAVVGTGINSVVCQSISTISIGAPLAGALIPLNEDFTITYTSDGSVDICALSSIGDLEVLYSNEPAGTHSKTACQLSETLYDNGETITIRIRDHAVNTTKTEVAVEGKISITLADITKEELDTNVEMSGTSNALAVKIEGQLPDNSWVELVASLATSSGLYIKSDVQLPEASGFTANRSTPIRVSSVTNNPATATKNIYTLATVTLTAIDSITATVAKTISGTTNGVSGKAYYRTSAVGEIPAGEWIEAGNIIVDEEADTWTYSITIPTADTYDIKVTDGTDSDAYDQQDSIVVASGLFEKLQIGTYYDTTAEATVNAINQIDAVYYDSAEDCFFVAGRTQQDNFYNSGVSVPAYDRPYFMRVEPDGSVTWCKQFEGAAFYALKTMARWFEYNSKLYYSFNIDSSSGADPHRFVTRINKDGSGLIYKNELGGLATQILGIQGTDLVVMDHNATNDTNMRKIDSGLSTFGAIHDGTIPYTIGNGNLFTRWISASEILVAGSSPTEKEANTMWSVPYSSGKYHWDSKTTLLAHSFAGAGYTGCRGISQDKLMACIYGNAGAGSAWYIKNAGGITATPSNDWGEIWMDGSNYILQTRTRLIKFDSGRNVLATKLITDEESTARMNAIVFDNYYTDGRMIVLGYTDANFDGNNAGNTTRNGIIWITEKPTE